MGELTQCYLMHYSERQLYNNTNYIIILTLLFSPCSQERRTQLLLSPPQYLPCIASHSCPAVASLELLTALPSKSNYGIDQLASKLARD